MVTINELFHDREQTFDKSIEIMYIVKDAADESAVATAMDTGIPSTIDGLNRSDLSIEERIDNTTWHVKAQFVPPSFSPLPTSDEVFTFNTTGGTLHTTQSIETVNRYSASGSPGDAPDFKGSIGFDGKNLAGVTINIPTYAFTEQHFFSDATVNNAFKETLRDITGTVNNASFKGFDAGEVLFLGVTGSKTGSGNWSITYSFASNKNRSNFSIGDIGGITAFGWEHVWVRYEDDKSGDSLTKVPRAVYVEKVYETEDFSQLGIGTT